MVALSAARAEDPSFLIEHARVFDGVKTIGRTNVLVEHGVIAAIGPDLKLPAGAQAVDGAGKTLLPGLIDAHAHVFPPSALKQALVFGVTTVLDMFTDANMAQQIRKDQAAGKDLDMADLRSAGTLVTAPGGHGTEYGIKIPTISGPSEAQSFVDARIAEGSDYIKIVYDDAREYGGGRVTPTLDKATLAAVIEAAHKRGKIVVVHIGTLEAAREVISAGADGLAHLFVGEHSDPEFGRFVAAHHAFVIPTLSVLYSICGKTPGAKLAADPKLAPYLSAQTIRSLQVTFPGIHNLSCAGAVEAIHQLQAAHVPILAGTDAPNPGTAQGVSLHGELAFLVEAGLTPVQALVAATSAPADAFHLSDRGRIAEGKRADLLLVNGDPDRNIEATRDIVAVWKQGVRDDREAYRASIEKENQEAKQQPVAAPPPGSESGVISDFDDGTMKTRFGAGWAVSTDTIAGGKSTANLTPVKDGANGSAGALDIAGEIKPDVPYAWAGAMFSPGAAPMAPANLSSKKELSFWTKGDGKTYRVMLFAQNRGYSPLIKTFVAGPEWKEMKFRIADFDGIDAHDLLGIVVAGGPAAGTFDFEIDDIRLQ